MTTAEKTPSITTTQDIGIPITQLEFQKILLLEELDVIDVTTLLDVKQYSESRVEAREQFTDRFAFYNMVELKEYQRIHYLWTQYMDFCVPPQLLLDPTRYSGDIQTARYEFNRRLAMFDCYRGVMGIFGKVGAGKSGFKAVHSFHGRTWFDIPVVAYKFRYTPAFGKYTYIKDDDFLEELMKTTKIVERDNGENILKWDDPEAKDEAMSVFKGAQVDIEEAHKVFPKGALTRLGTLLYDMMKEWRHYQCLISVITHDPDDLNKHVIKHLTHEAWVSRNSSLDRTSDIRLHNIETGEHKIPISLKRDNYYPLWKHNTPIAARSNISRSKANIVTERKEVV